MALTYFQDFLRDDGLPVTVEYSFRDIGWTGCEVDIVDVMPNTPGYEALCRRSLDFCRTVGDWGVSDPEIEALIKAAKAAIDLTADESDRMVAWIAEHHDA